MRTPNPSLDLLKEVKIGFLMQDTTLTRWCRENDTHVSNARNALIGTWNGPKGQAMRAQLVKAARVKAAA